MTSPTDGYVTTFASYDLDVQGLPLKLQRFRSPDHPKSPKPQQSVLLLHGGNTNSRLYHEPNGGLVRYLVGSGCDVWTLDWRGSSLVLRTVLSRQLEPSEILKERA